MKKNIETTYSTTKSNLYQLVFKNNEKVDLFSGRVFELPIEMTEKEMYYVISYVLDHIDLSKEMDICFFFKLDEYLERISFLTIESDLNEDINIIKISPNYTKYDWYIKNTEKSQIKKIYERIMYIFEEPQNFLNINKKTLKKQI